MRALLIVVVRLRAVEERERAGHADDEHEGRDQQLDEGVAALVGELGRRDLHARVIGRARGALEAHRTNIGSGPEGAGYQSPEGGQPPLPSTSHSLTSAAPSVWMSR